MTHAPQHDEIQQFFEDSQGLVEIIAFQQQDFATLIACATAGDPEATLMAYIVKETVNHIERKAALAKPFLCGACRATLTDGLYTIVLMVPDDAPKSAMGTGICAGCATDRENAKEKGAEAFRQMYPGLRLCAVTHPEGGRA
jgi:hypothetical protein